MAESKFTPEVRAALVERFAEGVSMVDASASVGVSLKTVKGWLTRGRREDIGLYAEFAERVEEARLAAKEREGPMSEKEHRIAVSRAARNGNVQAMKLYWEMLRAERGSEDEEPENPLRELDELATRRAVRA